MYSYSHKIVSERFPHPCCGAPAKYSRGISEDLIYTIASLMEDESVFHQDLFDPFSLSEILEYITSSHVYYINKKLLEIEQSILQLHPVKNEGSKFIALLHQQFLRYRSHLTEHIREEEDALIPYIRILSKSESKPLIAEQLAIMNYALADFMDTHDDTEDALHTLIAMIKAYYPDYLSMTPYRILVSQIQIFADDLKVHALIEDKVLIPRAKNAEQLFKNKVWQLVSCN